MLPTSCRTVATRMTKKKKDSSLSRELNFSTQLMNQVDTNPLRALRIVGWAFLGLFVVDVLLCFRILQLLHTPCTACCKSPLFLGGHLCDPVVHLHLERSIRVSTSSRFGFVPLLSQRKNGPLLRSRRMYYKCFHPIQC